MFNSLRSAVRLLKSDRRGVTALEYGLIASLIAVAIIAGARTLGGAINTEFNNIGTTISGLATNH
jgi:pilus assembly protein Flp/PilA